MHGAKHIKLQCFDTHGWYQC